MRPPGSPSWRGTGWGEGRGTAGGSRVKDDKGESWKDRRGGEGRTPESSPGMTARTRVCPVRVAEAERKEASRREGPQKRGAAETRKAGKTLLGWAGAARSLCIFEGQEVTGGWATVRAVAGPELA